MYLTSGAKVSTRRSRSARSFVRRYSLQSASESSEDILRAALRGAVASVMLVLHSNAKGPDGASYRPLSVHPLTAGRFGRTSIPTSGYLPGGLRTAETAPWPAPDRGPQVAPAPAESQASG